MVAFRGFVIIILLLVQYFAYRLGLMGAPEPRRFYRIGLTALDRIFGWTKGLRILNPEKCPVEGPAVLASNHLRLDDPFVTGAAIHLATEEKARVWGLMRDDFFEKWPQWLRRLLDPNQILFLLGGIPITRGRSSDEQLRPVYDLLLDSKMFLTYPGRSRSRNGHLIEYHDWIRTPGATSRFLARVQEERPELRVAAIPIARTYNPVTKGGAIAFGERHSLKPRATLGEQRELDYRLVAAMGDLVEVNIPHVVSGLLYLHCLHSRRECIQVSRLCAAASEVFAGIRNRLVDPAAYRNLERETRRTLRYLARRAMLRLRGQVVMLDTRAILSKPDAENYREGNCLKHLVNQIVHLRDVVAALERAVGLLNT